MKALRVRYRSQCYSLLQSLNISWRSRSEERAVTRQSSTIKSI